MNFFERQDETRRASRRLVLLFLLAVIAVVAAVDLVVFFILWHTPQQQFYPSLTEWMFAHPRNVVVTTLGVLAVIGLASLYKTLMLAGGGAVVARSLGGERVSPDTTDPQQRRLLNVVEEMAIASGVPMPEVYLLEHESGINAFAAGHNPSNAAIGVTRGTLETLDRAELQGVIAHEFSHILNGDMRLNVRLLGLLFGLLVVALIGRTILHGASNARVGRKGNAAGVVLLVALAVLVIGYIGLFFGRLIQAAVSRRREALADASAIQFTRDPTGLRGALVKIGATLQGSRIGKAQAEEVAHMLFAPGMRRWFATHPPLLERLKAIDPHFDPQEIDQMRARLAAAAARNASEAAQPAARRMTGSPIELPGTTPAQVAGLVGNPGTAHVLLAREIRKSLPAAVVAAGRHPASARALLLALALDADEDVRQQQKNFVSRQLGAQVGAAVMALEGEVDALEPELRIPALLRAFPALRQLAREERMELMSCLNGMLQREGRVSLHSYVLRKLAQVQLYDDLQPASRVSKLPLRAVREHARVLLCVLARHGHDDEMAATRAYEAGMQRLLPQGWPTYVVTANWAGGLDSALSRLDRLAPVAKEQLVEAMVATVTYDQRLTVSEAELLRAVCATLHCPLPPLVSPWDRPQSGLDASRADVRAPQSNITADGGPMGG